MRKRVKEIVQRGFFILNLIAMNIAFGIPVYAAKDEKKDTNPILNSTLVQGTINLMNDSVIALLAVEAVLLGLLEAWQGIRWQAAPDEDKPKFVKSMKTILIAGIIIICLTGAGGIVSLILSYYTKPAAA